jgi:MarR family transcriptional regulator, organic hydroperoxide resistance regulator
MEHAMAPGEAVRLSERERIAQIENISRVLMQLSWVAQKQFAQSVAQHELTFPQFLTLAFLVKASQHCSMNQLAEATHQDAATMTGVVDRLERLGLVERARSIEDRRVVLVRPRKEAIVLLNAVKNARDLMMAQLFEGFDDEALSDLSHQLEKLWQAMETQARSY